jgi:hypothetical protein
MISFIRIVYLLRSQLRPDKRRSREAPKKIFPTSLKPQIIPKGYLHSKKFCAKISHEVLRDLAEIFSVSAHRGQVSDKLTPLCNHDGRKYSPDDGSNSYVPDTSELQTRWHGGWIYCTCNIYYNGSKISEVPYFSARVFWIIPWIRRCLSLMATRDWLMRLISSRAVSRISIRSRAV